MEALAYIRDHVIKSKTLLIEGDDIICTDVNGTELKKFPKHTVTAFHSKTSKKPYDLLAIATCYKYAALTFGEYVTKCRAEKAGMVSTVDKKELIAYLKGDIDTSAQIYTLEASKDTAQSDTSLTEPVEIKIKSEVKAAMPNQKRQRIESNSQEKRPTNENGAHEKKRISDQERPREHAKSAVIDPQNVFDKTMQRIMERECTFRNRTNILNASTKTFENVLKTIEVVNAETKERFEKASKASLIAPTAVRKEKVPLSQLMRDRIKGTPIIIVPSGFSDLLTMYNVKEFLEDGIYVPIMQKKKDGKRKEQSFVVEHEHNGEKFTFKIMDSINRFKDKDWRCVVGVLVSGQAWQFKGWRWKFPLEVFKRVCGIHIHRQGSQFSEEIKQWDVKILMIHPDKRHLDKVAAKEFWRYLFEFLTHRLQNMN